MKTVIEMAREAGLRVGPAGMGQTVWGSDEELARFASLVRADERNALTKEKDKLRNRIAYLLQPPIVVAVGCFLLAYIVGFK